MEEQVMRLKLNVVGVQKRVADEEARVKPLPKVRVQPKRPQKPKVTITVTAEPAKQQINALVKTSLISELEVELGAIKRERGKLSSRIHYLVEEIRVRLSGENELVANEFMNGSLPDAELARHYAAIQALTEKAGDVFKKKRYVEQHGQLPVEEKQPVTLKVAMDGEQINAMNHEIRRLDDLIHKTTKKLKQNNSGLKKPVNLERISIWKEKIELAEVRRFELKQKIKRMAYE